MPPHLVSMTIVAAFLTTLSGPDPGAFAQRYLARLDQELNLTEAQEQQVGEAIEEFSRHVADAGSGGPIARLQMMRKAQSWQRAFEAEVEATLTERQRTLYVAHRDTWRQEAARSVMLEHMKASIALTDRQVSQLDPIIAKAQQRAQALREGTIDMESLRQLKALREDLEGGISAILTEEQRAKRAELRQTRAAKPQGALPGLLEE